MGIIIASEASQDTYDAVMNGAVSASDAYHAINIARTPEGQALALQERRKGGKVQSWDYVTAFVRGVESQQYAGAQLDLFGNDTSWQETAAKTAKYVSKARAVIKEQMQVIRSGRKLEKQSKVAKKLGVEVKNPEDATQLLQRLALLDAAYERMDGDLGIPAKVEAWDGKSTPESYLSDIPYSYQIATASLSLSEREQRVVNAFDMIDRQSPIDVDFADISRMSDKEVRVKMKEKLEELKDKESSRAKAPAKFNIGDKIINIGGGGRKKVAHHIADKRVAAAFLSLDKIGETARLVDSQSNTEPTKKSKINVLSHDYYLNKISLESEGVINEAYVLLVIENHKKDDFFHDLNIRDIKVLDTIEATIDNLPEGRFTKSGLSNSQGGSRNRIDEYLRVVKRNRENSSFSISSTPRLAPNGKPSNLTEKQWHQVRTPEFKAWFGDWENDTFTRWQIKKAIYHLFTTFFTTFNLFIFILLCYYSLKAANEKHFLLIRARARARAKP